MICARYLSAVFSRSLQHRRSSTCNIGYIGAIDYRDTKDPSFALYEIDRSLVFLAIQFVRRGGVICMDQQMTTDVAALLEQGNSLLLHGQVTEAGAAFSRAVELDQSSARAHLGVAETNLALGAYDIVSIACRHVLDLAPNS